MHTYAQPPTPASQRRGFRVPEVFAGRAVLRSVFVRAQNGEEWQVLAEDLFAIHPYREEVIATIWSAPEFTR